MDGVRSGLGCDSRDHPFGRPEYREAEANPCGPAVAEEEPTSAYLAERSIHCYRSGSRDMVRSPVDYWEEGSCTERTATDMRSGWDN